MELFSKKNTYKAKVLCMNCLYSCLEIEIEKGKTKAEAENEMDKMCPRCGTKSLFIIK